MRSAIQISSKEHVVSQDSVPGEYRPCLKYAMRTLHLDSFISP